MVINQSATDKIKAQLVMVVGFLVLGFIFKTYQTYFLYTATILGLIFIILPFLGDYIVKGWFKLAELLGWINSKVILSLVFFVFLFPIAVLFRLSNKNPLQIRKTDEKSVFTDRNHKYTAKDLENIW
jgi:hypothetical protein